MDPSTIAVVVLLGLVVLRTVLLALGAALIIRPVRECPACFDTTFSLHRRWLRLIAPWLEWRFCPRCGWGGPARRLRTRPRPGIRAADPAEPLPWSDESGRPDA